MAPFFLDTNILVYSFGENEPRKRGIARALVESGDAAISSQNLSELASVLTIRSPFRQALEQTLPVYRPRRKGKRRG